MVGNKIYKCGNYLRLSKEDIRHGKDESSSIESQRLINSSFAKYNGLNIVREYVDDGFSGGNFNRPGFERMIKDIENGVINCVITKDLSRLGREMYKTGQYIEEYFLEHDVRYIAINDSYDSNVGDSMLGIRLGVNDLYLREVSKKVKTSFRIKQEKGDYIGSFACYGYKKDPTNHHHLIIDEKAAKVVRMIYKMVLDGLGITRICKKLTDSKIPIPIVYKKESRGLLVTENEGYGVWKHATVKNILTSQMYIGNMVQHTYEKPSHTSKKLKKIDCTNQIIVKNTHEAIISEEEYQEVQKILNSKSRVSSVKKYDKYLLSGLLICGNCGHNLGISERQRKKGVSRYTYCNLYQRKGKYSNCTPNRINYNYLEEDILLFLKELGSKFLKKYDSSKLVEDAIYYFNRDVEKLNNDLVNVSKKIDKKYKVISSLYNDKVDNVISVDVYKKLSKEHEEELKLLQEEKQEIEEKLKLYSSDTYEKEFCKCRKAVEEFMSLKNPSKSVIKKLISRIVISDGEEKNVKVYLRFRNLTEIVKDMVQA